MMPRALRELVNRGSLGHATLIAGGTPIEWETMSQEIRQTLEVAAADMFFYSEPPKITELRRLLERVHLKPNQSSLVLVSFTHLDRWSPDVANALLKTLEEPPEHARFLLFATDESSVLPTIRSRSARYRLPTIALTREEDGILTLDKLLSGSLREQFEYVASLVERESVQAVLDEWIHTSKNAATQRRLLDRRSEASDRAVNKRLFLDRIVLEERQWSKTNVI